LLQDRQPRLQSRSKEKDLERARKPSSSAQGVGGGFAGAAAKLVTPSAPAPVLEPAPPRSVAQTVTVEPAPQAIVANQAARGELAKNESETKAANEKRDAAYSRSTSPMPAVAVAAPAPAEPALQQSSQDVQVSAEDSAITALPARGRQAAEMTNLNPQLLLTSGGAAVTVSAARRARIVEDRAGPASFCFPRTAEKPGSCSRAGTITDLLAGSAPSDKVCWIVGRSGNHSAHVRQRKALEESYAALLRMIALGFCRQRSPGHRVARQWHIQDLRRGRHLEAAAA